MNTNGNIYTVIYTTIVVVVVAAVLAFASETLKPRQEANVKADAISQMLTASKFFEKSELEAMSNDQILEAYRNVAKSAILVNAEGEECGTLDLARQEIFTTSQLKAQDKNIKDGKEVTLPVFEFEKDGEKVTVLPCYGAGLWGPIWGYVALCDDLQTIRGAYFDHASETPGLGAKIKDDPSFRAEFEGKKIDFNDAEAAFSIVKGGAPAGKMNAVDAISGASITSKALGVSINNWIMAYKPFLQNAATLAEPAENVADTLSTCSCCDSLSIAK